MRDIDDDYPSLDVFDAIHRELVTIIGHCTFHRSMLQDLLLRSANESDSPEQTLQRWRDESIASVEQLRFSDLNKQDKALAAAVYDESTRIAESFWNVLLSRVHERARVAPEDASLSTAEETARAAARDGTAG
jgi:hypothetical protein